MFSNFHSILILTILYLIEAEDIFEIRSKRASLKRYKSNFTLPIKYYYGFTSNCRIIEKALHHISEYTCLTFHKEKKRFSGLGIIFDRDSFNDVYDHLEKRETSLIKVTNKCTNKIGCIKHLVVRALGLLPQTIRWDRNSYIRVLEKNLDEEGLKRYKKKYGGRVRIMNTAFDFGSISHYERNYMAKKGKYAYESKMNKLYNKMLGQRYDLSHNDIKLLNDFYCGNVCPEKVIGCVNGGYPDPKACDYCKCPRGYSGKRCEDIVESDPECGKTHLYASQNEKTLTINSSLTCTYLLKSKPKTKIEVTVVETNLNGHKPCAEGLGLEIKNRHDKGTTGLCLCGKNENVKMKGIFSQVFVQYHGENDDDFAILKYKAVSAKQAEEFDYTA
uniref:Metalloendopeptidase n=1 Tax=Parastrongyloides trichosuri TaxID=131310 RepID=A0A0N4ZDX2_PARTI